MEFIYIFRFGIILFIGLLIATGAVGIYLASKMYEKVSRMDRELDVYCITLDDAVERRKVIDDNFVSIEGLNLQYVPAVDTRDDKWREYIHHLTPDAVNQLEKNLKKNKRDHHHELTPGAVGCFLSHIKCWKKFIDTKPDDRDMVFILEDDTLPIPSFQDHLEHILSNLPVDTDLCLLSYAIIKDDHVEIKIKDYPLYKMNRYCAFYFTNAYIITGAGVKKIWNDLSKRHFLFSKQIDSHLTELVNNDLLTIYYTKTNICPQSGLTPTTIQTLSV